MSISFPDSGSIHLNNDELKTNVLRAGAGRAEIELPAELFPTEGFSGVHDKLHARVLLLEMGNKVAFVSIELTSLPGEIIVSLQKIVGEIASVLPENVLICVTHTFSAPHFLPAHLCKTQADQQKNDLLFQALKISVSKAVSKSVEGMQNARFGSEVGFCNVNVNRDVCTEDGWWLGNNETGPSDKSVPVLRFETMNGNLIALLFSYAVQPSVMDSPQTNDNSRMVTADLAGAASRFLEQEYGNGITALFCVGAAADQAPSIKGAKYQYVGKDGHIRVKNIAKQGYIIAEMLGNRLGIEVLQISEKMNCQALTESINCNKGLAICPGQKLTFDIHSLHPTKQYEFIPAEDHQEPVEIIKLGNVALIGVRPELCSLTAADIKEQSPFTITMVLTMVNGGAKYMPEKTAYDRITYEAMNSPFARGSAELLTEKIIELLKF